MTTLVIAIGTALIALYQATNGSSWKHNTGWHTGDPCRHSWYGILCSADSTISSMYATCTVVPSHPYLYCELINAAAAATAT
jgi:hypothetical protein